MKSIIEYINDFVIVKDSFGDKPYSVSKEFYIDKNYPVYFFSNYKNAIDFIKEVQK